jgi:hypothetical protein
MMAMLDKIFYKIEAYRKQKRYTSYSIPTDIANIGENSLLFYFGNIHSQRGQDGILSEIFRRLEIRQGSFVEFGAWDGKYLCNSRWLYERGWSGAFIEGDKDRYEALKHGYSDERKIIPIHAFVGAPTFGVPGKCLRNILEEVKFDVENVDFLSIDVDGCDLELFLGGEILPKVVLLEGGFNFSPFMETEASVSAWNSGLQHPLAYIQSKAEEAGYTLICFYQDSYLVRSDLADPFKDCIKDVADFYAEAFYFMPQDFRTVLIDFRKNNIHVQQMEKKYFGQFCENPISPIYSAIRQS